MRKDGRATGQAGEYFVAAEVCRRGGTATTFTSNMPGFDIVAGDAAGNRQVQISVEAKNTEAFWTTDGIRDAMVRPDGEVPRFWVFVDLSGGRVPEYYVVPDKDVRDSIRRMHGEYQERYEAKHGHRRGNPIHGVRVKDIEKFRDCWDILESSLMTMPSHLARPLTLPANSKGCPTPDGQFCLGSRPQGHGNLPAAVAVRRTRHRAQSRPATLSVPQTAERAGVATDSANGRPAAHASQGSVPREPALGVAACGACGWALARRQGRRRHHHPRAGRAVPHRPAYAHGRVAQRWQLSADRGEPVLGAVQLPGDHVLDI